MQDVTKGTGKYIDWDADWREQRNNFLCLNRIETKHEFPVHAFAVLQYIK